MIYREDLERAHAKKKAYKKLTVRLKKVKDKELDRVFEDEHDHAFESIDCLECANCCKTTSPIFRDVDIKRLSKSLKMNAGDFTEKYLKMDEERDYVLQSSPCPFLLDDNKCSIYENRPKACREYPHTDCKPMKPILNLTLRNTRVCPAVSRIMEKLEQQY